ncbi:hypothetical protein BJ138DRAFT_99990 [Hygrophoropsis aurantiaca]|uniref:Uncharacterized protein n=1 Tax=Hygrophoropsis aurantiaca TaxID=72124 RepID=A0ACB8AAQ0_9AGAM|nr:hypothetical protein BJ138DRAFT_99990 [Hygrophoropsis aurantiaca]
MRTPGEMSPGRVTSQSIKQPSFDPINNNKQEPIALTVPLSVSGNVLLSSRFLSNQFLKAYKQTGYSRAHWAFILACILTYAMAFPYHPDPQGTPCAACRVLLVLDAQVGMLADPPLARAEIHPPRIIHVRNTGDVGEVDEPNTPGWQLAFPPLSPHEYVIDKLKNNAFAGTKLGDLITPEAEIIVVGMQSDFCIRATCSAALGRGNEVLLIKGAHATYNRLEVWNGGGITPAQTIEAEIEAELEEAGVILLEMKDLPGLFTDR